jgi:hypothetical protein
MLPWLLTVAIALSCVGSAGADDPQPNSSDPSAVNLPIPEASPIPVPPTSAAELPYSIAFDATVASRYIFQGFDYSGAAVTQPDLVFGYRGWSAVMWANFQPGDSEFNEVDLTLKYGHAFKRLTLAAGYNKLDYPNRVGWNPSQEVLLEAALQAPLSPAYSVHYDFDQGDGAYMQLGLTRGAGPRLTLATNLFYQLHYYAMTGIPSIELKAATNLSLGRLAFTPAVSYFATSDNGDFTGPSRLPRTWLFALNVAQTIR